MSILVRRLGLLGVFAFLIVPASGVLAAHSSSAAVEQHWELLGRSVSATGAAVSEQIERGFLVGGTSSFDPAPVVTLEVVARVTGGSAGYGWDVRLRRDSSVNLASIPFYGSDSSFTLKSVSFTWPGSGSQRLKEFYLNPFGTTPGTLEVKKAYLKIRQTGAIKKIIGRVPVAGFEEGITSTSWTAPSDPVFYTHHADYDPAPTAKLRVGGQVTSASGTMNAALYRWDTAPAQQVELPPFFRTVWVRCYAASSAFCFS